MALSKVRVQLLNEKTGEVIEEVDVLTSPDSVLFADGKTLTQVLQEIETTPGEKGDKGTSLRTRGAWAPSTAYVANQQYIDIVSKDGTAYACKASHTSTSTWDASKWMVLVERGPAGAPGATTADGVSYGNKSVKEVLDDLLYTAIQLTAFTNNVNTVEMGTTVNTVRLDWNYNKTPKTLTLDNAPVDVSTKTKTIEGAGIKTNKTYTLKAMDDRNASSQKTTAITFLNGIYWGVAAKKTSFDSAFVLTLTKGLQGSKAKTFTVNAGAGQHIYYAIPTRYGTPAFKVGGFDGGFSKAGTIQFKNASGYTESYDIWISDNAGLGNTTVNVA